MKRPEKKIADVKVTEEDIALFALGIEEKDFVLPSERNTYLSDSKARALVEAVRLGKDITGQDFSNINLKGADISGGRFKDCNFSGAIFYETKAQSCDFQGVDFTDAYIEKSSFENSDFTHATIKRVFLRDNDFEKADLDEEAETYLSSFDKILSLIEQGKVDIRVLSKSDLLCVDIRRLDFSHIDTMGIDLSAFALDGINLSGTYIDPKQLLSLQGLQKYYLDIKKLRAKKRKLLEQEILEERETALNMFSLKEAGKNKKRAKLKSIKRPQFKKIEPEEFVSWPRPKEKQKDTEKIKDKKINNKIDVIQVKNEEKTINKTYLQKINLPEKKDEIKTEPVKRTQDDLNKENIKIRVQQNKLEKPKQQVKEETPITKESLSKVQIKQRKQVKQNIESKKEEKPVEKKKTTPSEVSDTSSTDTARVKKQKSAPEQGVQQGAKKIVSQKQNVKPTKFKTKG